MFFPEPFESCHMTWREVGFSFLEAGNFPVLSWQKCSMKTNNFVQPVHQEDVLTNPRLLSPWETDHIVSPVMKLLTHSSDSQSLGCPRTNIPNILLKRCNNVILWWFVLFFAFRCGGLFNHTWTNCVQMLQTPESLRQLKLYWIWN